MYNEASIEALVKRIGWAEAVPPTTIVVSEDNLESTSGRYFNSFNPLVIVENILASITNKDADNDTLNTELSRLRSDGVNDVLLKVYNLNTRATAEVTNFVTSINYAADYSASIVANQQSFDDAIGLSVAIKSLELISTTNRSNARANNPKIDNQEIQAFFHGAFSATGKVISKGLYAQYAEAIGKLIEVLFPVSYPESSEVIVGSDGGVTVKTTPKPTLKGRRVW